MVHLLWGALVGSSECEPDYDGIMGTLSEQSAFNLSTLRCAAGTDVGMRRDENQDCFGIFKSDLYHGYFVADGMGGVHGGATASRLAISTLEELLPKGGGRVGPDRLISIASQANIPVREELVKPEQLNGREIWALSSLHGIRVVTGWDALPDGPAAPEHADSFRRRLRMLLTALD